MLKSDKERTDPDHVVQKNYERRENLKTKSPISGEMKKAKEIMDKSKDFPKSLREVWGQVFPYHIYYFHAILPKWHVP